MMASPIRIDYTHDGFTPTLPPPSPPPPQLHLLT